MPQPSTGCGLAQSHRHSNAYAVTSRPLLRCPSQRPPLSSCVLSNLLLFTLHAPKWPLRPWCWPCMRSHFGDCSACRGATPAPMVIPAQVIAGLYYAEPEPMRHALSPVPLAPPEPVVQPEACAQATAHQPQPKPKPQPLPKAVASPDPAPATAPTGTLDPEPTAPATPQHLRQRRPRPAPTPQHLRPSSCHRAARHT